jgi:acyl-homoserine-lactone acylase
VIAAALLALVLAPADPAPATATILRDTWGIPHVYAETAGDAAYAHGYAQAEDRLDDVLLAYLAAEGRAASVLGESRLERDLEARMARHAEVARERYAELSADARELIERFVAGVRAYMREHPEVVPAWGRPPEPHQVVALYRAFIWPWPWRQARGDLRRRPDAGAAGERGSNAWVVGASRSAAGVPIALIDPHLSWEPETRFYESGVHGGGFDFYGFSVIGTPFMAIGHTDVLSLACTTGGPDCADVYELRIKPDDPARYEFDGAWRPIASEEVAIEVRTPGGTRTERRRIERTHHGPILERAGGAAWAARTAYDREVGIFDQWLAMVRARDLGDLLKALRLGQSLPQNILVADVHGNTYYVRAGRVPLRPAGYAWDAPVPGWTSKTEWLGFRPLADLVQVLNPAAGFMQNCNVAPAAMMPSSPLTAERYAPDVYNVSPDRTNARGRRALALLGEHEKLTVEDALRIAGDTYVASAEPWQRALAGAIARHGAGLAHLDEPARLLAAWDRRVDPESREAALYRFWMLQLERDGTLASAADAVERGTELGGEVGRSLLSSLERAAERMREGGGRLDAPWGDRHRLRRGGRSWPVGGCSGDGLDTLRSIRFAEPDERGISYATGGLICPTVVVLDEGAVVSYSATPFGQSNHPTSPHYTDQAEKLTSRGRLKRNWFLREDVLGHLESRRTLVVPPR